ncbi:hypothetical protein N656DRAFT_516736 [Canariomyces notabilis]|uniref:Uncharacterized protein n=1 Tax=Canariomyces notabilis TaxID=2074819 RepID=A0AAN6QEI2_9PEZI|nr:hypothetical protein N656DRAFT_516736 [Canariomyces arenarius]
MPIPTQRWAKHEFTYTNMGCLPPTLQPLHTHACAHCMRHSPLTNPAGSWSLDPWLISIFWATLRTLRAWKVMTPLLRLCAKLSPNARFEKLCSSNRASSDGEHQTSKLPRFPASNPIRWPSVRTGLMQWQYQAIGDWSSSCIPPFSRFTIRAFLVGSIFRKALQRTSVLYCTVLYIHTLAGRYCTPENPNI